MSEPIELRFASVVAASPGVVWERAGTIRGVNDELWPLARMTFPFALDRSTRPEQVVGHRLRSWTLALGFVPVDRRTLQIEVFEEGRFRECSTSPLQGHSCHERTAVAGDDGSTILTDTLVIESRGRLVDAFVRATVTRTFLRRHRRLQRHSTRHPDEGRAGQRLLGSSPVPPKKKPSLPVTGNPEADELLVADPLARLIGMWLDLHIP